MGKVLVENRYKGELTSNLATSDTVLHLKAGRGANFPEVPQASDNWFFVTLVDKNGSKEIIKIVMRAPGSDDLIVGSSASDQPGGNVSGRAQEETAALAVTATDNHLVEQRLTAGMFQAVIDDIESILEALANIIPIGEIILFEKDTAVTGYTLLTDADDIQVYITKGSEAEGEAGGTNKTGGTWEQPVHTHTGPLHAHPTNDHTLTVDEMPSHGHTVLSGGAHAHTANGRRYAGIDHGSASETFADETFGSGRFWSWLSLPLQILSGGAHPHEIEDTGGGSAHNHGDTDEAGNGDTGEASTVNTWRPPGRNFTRQQRN